MIVHEGDKESIAILAESWENSSLTLLASSPLTTNPLQGSSPDLCVEKRQVVVMIWMNQGKEPMNMSTRHPSVFLSLSLMKVTINFNLFQLLRHQLHSFICHGIALLLLLKRALLMIDGALGERVDVSFVDTSFGCCSQINTTGTLSEEDVHLDKPAHTDRKFIVLKSNLRQLFRHCSLCGELVVQMSMREAGTAIVVTCNNRKGTNIIGIHSQ